MLDLNLGISPPSNCPKDDDGHLRFQSGPCFPNDRSTMVNTKQRIRETFQFLFSNESSQN